MKENLITKTETLRNNIKNTTLNLNDLRYQFLEQGETEMVQALAPFSLLKSLVNLKIVYRISDYHSKVFSLSNNKPLSWGLFYVGLYDKI